MSSGTGDGVDSPSQESENTENATLFQNSGMGNLALRAVTLGMFIILGFVGNSVLVATIAQSARLRNSVLNLFIISIAIVNLLDCTANLPLVLGATITEEWDYGDFACHLNAFGLQLTSICMIMGLCLMALDRMLAVLNTAKYQRRLTPLRASLLIVYSWLHAAVLSFPLLGKLDTVPVGAYRARYLCALSYGASTAYICLIAILGYLIPSLLIIGFFVVIIKIGVQEKMKERRMSTPYEEGTVEVSQVWVAIKISKYVGVLFVLWCIFQGPYLMLSSVEQSRNSIDIPETTALDFDYPWQVDLAFTWMKLCYPIFLPVFTFLWKKEVWQKFKKFVLCHKSNLIVDATGQSSSPRERGGNPGAESVTRATDTQSNSVPVLFATENGLHFQTFTKNGEPDPASEFTTKQVEKKITKENNLTARKCDVYGSQDLLQIDEDTSDYDSSGELDQVLDPYSNSNPVSVKTDYSRQHSNRSGNSNTDSVDQITTERKESVTNENRTDSKERKKKKPKPRKAEAVESPHQSAEAEEPRDVPEEDRSAQGSIRGDRVSHDSGRASMEGGSLGKQKRKKEEQKNVDMADREKPQGKKSSTKYEVDPAEVAPQPVAEHLTIEDETAGGQSPKPLKKRKKKKKPPPRETAEEEAIEMKQTEIPIVHPEHPRKVPIPPPRLKPIERKTPMDLYSGSDSFGLPELTKIPPKQLGLRQLSVQPQSHPDTDVDVTEGQLRSKCKSEPNILDLDEAGGAPPDHPARPVSVKTVEAFAGRTSGGGQSSNTKRDKHQRKSTSDSQTNLLGGSNTSTDLSELSDLKPAPVSNASSSKAPAKPKRQKKRPADHADESGVVVVRAESQQELLYDTSPR